MKVWGGNDVTDRDINMTGLDAYVYSRPYGESTHGGDIYFLSSCATGRIIRMLVADISGHGKSVDEPAQKLRTFMQRYINQIDQIRFVKAMNLALMKFTKAGMFATAVVATYFTPTKTLTLTNAGHPPPLYFNSATASWSLLQTHLEDNKTPTDIPLGILKLSEYKSLTKQLKQDDMVLCYTDALIECSNSKSEILGQNGLMDLLNHLKLSEPKFLITNLLEALSQQYPENLKGDDVTLLLFTPNLLFETTYKKPNMRSHLQIMKNVMHKIGKKDDPIPWPDLHPANLGGAFFNFMNKLWRSKDK